MRVKGQGNLQLTLQSYDEIYENELSPISMESITNKTPTKLSNFTQQGAKLRVETTEIDEIFTINQIIIYVKPVGSSFPG